MNCTNPVTITKNLDRLDYPDGLLVPCGKCLNCRIQYREQWGMRLTHEMSYNEDGIFLTLTYDQKNVPINDAFQLTLKKEHAQKFFKRLRKNLKGKKIKYFLCGEYGDETKRPHYHAIVFGISRKEIPKIKQSWNFCDWKNPSICKDSFGMVEHDSINYVCQYIDKKFTGELANEEYYQKGIEAPFRLCSKGIGKDYCEDNEDRIRDLEYITVRGTKRSVPRYYLDRIGKDNKNNKHKKPSLKLKLKLTEIDERSKIGSSDLGRSAAPGRLAYAVKKEIERINKILGREVNLTQAEAYRYLSNDEVIKIDDDIKKQNAQLELNRKRKADIKHRRDLKH